MCLVTDGQLPLRQCLHPEAGAKDIHLPAYYWKFSDLKKEYFRSKLSSSAQLSINDLTKLPNNITTSNVPPTASIADIMNGKYEITAVTSLTKHS